MLKKENFPAFILVLFFLFIGIYSCYDNYKSRSENIIEFTLLCIDNEYNEVYEEQFLSLNPFDYLYENRAQKRLIWISKIQDFNSYSDYVVTVATLKDPKSGKADFSKLKRAGDFFYYGLNGQEFDYKVSVTDARNANLDCSIIDIWIKDHL
jgi:hypothetical protein